MGEIVICWKAELKQMLQILASWGKNWEEIINAPIILKNIKIAYVDWRAIPAYVGNVRNGVVTDINICVLHYMGNVGWEHKQFAAND